MNTREKIVFLTSIEKKVVNIAKYILIFLLVFFGVYLALSYFAVRFILNLSTNFTSWFFLGGIFLIFLCGILGLLLKYATAIFSYSAGDKKSGADSLFVALLGSVLLLPIFGLFLSGYAPNNRPKARDARRMSDMKQLAEAQVMYFNEQGRYFTCSQTGGDCGGSNGNYPSFIGNYLTEAPLDPNGSEHRYGGIDNTVTSGRFCYFANLENTNTAAAGCSNGCDFYTATDLGNFYVMQRPDTMDSCVNEKQAGAAVTDKK